MAALLRYFFAVEKVAKRHILARMHLLEFF